MRTSCATAHLQGQAEVGALVRHSIHLAFVFLNQHLALLLRLDHDAPARGRQLLLGCQLRPPAMTHAARHIDYPAML